MKTYFSNLDWDLLKQFKLIIDSGTIDDAVKIHSISRPTVTRIFDSLESHIGEKLYERYNRGEIKLTAMGHYLYSQIQQIEPLILNIQPTHYKQKNTKSPFLIATSHGIASIFLAKRMEILSNTFPNLCFHIKTNFTDPYEAIKTNHMLIYSKISNLPNLISKKLVNIKYGMFASKKYLANKNTIKTLKDLEQHDFIGYSGQQNIYFNESDTFMYNLINSKKKVSSFFSINTNSAMGEWMLAYRGLGIACLCIEENLIKSLDLVPIFPEYNYQSELYIYYKENQFDLPFDKIYNNLKD